MTVTRGGHDGGGGCDIGSCENAFVATLLQLHNDAFDDFDRMTRMIRVVASKVTVGAETINRVLAIEVDQFKAAHA
jgi:hypothetical protein